MPPQTGPGVPVIVDVLLNDVDPERDPLRLGGFSPPQSVGQATLGEVTETVGPSGLPALRFAPTEGFEGTAVFTYRPVDALEAVGDDVEVRVEVARRRRPQPTAARSSRRGSAATRRDDAAAGAGQRCRSRWRRLDAVGRRAAPGRASRSRSRGLSWRSRREPAPLRWRRSPTPSTTATATSCAGRCWSV